MWDMLGQVYPAFLNNFNKLALKNVEYLEFSDKMLRYS